jgi:hypothetical protein
VVVAEHHQDVGLGRQEPPRISGGLQDPPLVVLGRA